jgi:hypothetical protein
MPSQPVNKIQFERYLAQTASIAIDAISCFELQYSLAVPSHQKKYKDVFAKHEKVFAFVRPAIFSFLVLSLFKLLDESKNPVSMHRCISMALQLSLISKEQKKILTAQINRVKPIWKQVCTLRHQAVAHRDHTVSISKVFESANVSPKDLRTLALTYCDVVNVLMKACGSAGFNPREYSKRLFENSQVFLDDLLVAARRVNSTES